MRAFTAREAIQLALRDADEAARARRGLKKFFKRADAITRRPGWVAHARAQIPLRLDRVRWAVCPKCGERFVSEAWDSGRWTRYCSVKCRGRGR